MLNVRGDNGQELTAQLGSVDIPTVVEFGKHLDAVETAAPLTEVQAYTVPRPGGPPEWQPPVGVTTTAPPEWSGAPAQPTWQPPPQNIVPQAGPPADQMLCNHNMVRTRWEGIAKSGPNKGKPYVAYYCPLPQERKAEQCKPVYA